MSQPPLRYHCRHIHVSGHRCGSPALRNEPFCYHHHTTRRPPASPQPNFQVPALEDRTAVQLALTEVLNRVAGGNLDPKRASLLLYGLQIASNNLPPHNKTQPNTETIEDIELDQQNQPLAPTAEFATAHRGRTLEEIILGNWEEEKAIQAAEKAEREANQAAGEAMLYTLSAIQATAEQPTRDSTNPRLLQLVDRFKSKLKHPELTTHSSKLSAQSFKLRAVS